MDSVWTPWPSASTHVAQRPDKKKGITVIQDRYLMLDRRRLAR